MADTPVMFPPGRARLATRPVSTGSPAVGDDGNLAGRLLRRMCARREQRNYQIYLGRHQHCSKLGKSIDFSFCRYKIEQHVLLLDIPGLTQFVAHRAQEGCR